MKGIEMFNIPRNSGKERVEDQITPVTKIFYEDTFRDLAFSIKETCKRKKRNAKY
jgi:hypothetical protein